MQCIPYQQSANATFSFLFPAEGMKKKSNMQTDGKLNTDGGGGYLYKAMNVDESRQTEEYVIKGILS